MSWVNFVAFRYFKARKKDKFVNTTTRIMMFSLSAAIAMLILSCSVIRGFEEAILAKVLKENGHLMIMDSKNYDPSLVLEKIQKELKNELKAYKVIESHALLAGPNPESVLIKGVEKEILESLTVLKGTNTKSSLPSVYIGYKFAENLGLTIGDTLDLIIPFKAEPPFYVVPEVVTVRIKKIVKFSMHDLNRFGLFMDIDEARNILGMQEKQVHKIICFGKDAKVALNYMPILEKAFPDKAVYSWQNMNMLFADIMRLQRNMVMVILFVIIFLVAVIASAALILLINTKKREISILIILGATRRQIIQIFMITSFYYHYFLSL